VTKEAKINAWLKHGADNLLNFQRSPFHETLRSASRDHYTNIFENYAEDLLAVRAKVSDVSAYGSK